MWMPSFAVAICIETLRARERPALSVIQPVFVVTRGCLAQKV